MIFQNAKDEIANHPQDRCPCAKAVGPLSAVFGPYARLLAGGCWGVAVVGSWPSSPLVPFSNTTRLARLHYYDHHHHECGETKIPDFFDGGVYFLKKGVYLFAAPIVGKSALGSVSSYQVSD